MTGKYRQAHEQDNKTPTYSSKDSSRIFLQIAKTTALDAAEQLLLLLQDPRGRAQRNGGN